MSPRQIDIRTQLTPEELEYYDACARIRGVTRTSLLRILLKIVARDHMIAGILDDDARPERTASLVKEYGLTMTRSYTPTIFDDSRYNRACSSCTNWLRTGTQPGKDGVVTAPCMLTFDARAGARPMEQKRGSDACGKWKRCK